MKFEKTWTRYASFLTNGTDAVEVQCSRFSCGIDPLPGMLVGVLDGQYYINGKPAWLEIREV